MTPSDDTQTLVRHGPGFLASGVIAFAVDAGMTSFLTRGLGVPPVSARIAAIGVAIIVAWACHRRLTFGVTAAPTFAEFARYLAVAWVSAAVNFGVYAGALFVLPWLPPEVAVAGATGVSMVVSYVGMRFGVFTKVS